MNIASMKNRLLCSITQKGFQIQGFFLRCLSNTKITISQIENP